MSKESEPKPIEKQTKPTDIDESKRKFLVGSVGVLGGIGAICALKPLVSSWMPSDKAQAAGGPITLDIRHLQPGQQLVAKWRGKPVWVIYRTKTMLEQLQNDDQRLRDPQSLVDQQPQYAQNQYRSINPNYLVLVGVCTHLGCSPNFKPTPGEVDQNWPGGFYCPCHGSTFDLSGRVFKGVPAPINLEVPPYHFVDEHTIVIGEDQA